MLLYQYGGVLMHSVVNLIVLDQISFTVDLEMKIQTHVDFWSGAMPILNNHPTGRKDNCNSKLVQGPGMDNFRIKMKNVRNQKNEMSSEIGM